MTLTLTTEQAETIVKALYAQAGRNDEAFGVLHRDNVFALGGTISECRDTVNKPLYEVIDLIGAAKEGE